MKTYKSKEGLQFRISEFPLPNEGEIVHFTKTEWEWIKSQNLSSDEFRVLWLMKREDYTYNPIPKSDIEKAKSIGVRYAEEIKEMLKGRRRNVEQEKQIQSDEG